MGGIEGLLSWHTRTFDALNQIRADFRLPEEHPSAILYPVLRFYIDHSIMVLNAQALKDATSLEASPDQISGLSRKSLEIATRMLDMTLSEWRLREFLTGFINNQWIMICHAAAEVLFVSISCHNCYP